MSENCGNCGASPGSRHSEHCDVARCSLHGTQYISCQYCYTYDDDDNVTLLYPDAQPSIWHGEWPGVLECRELGYWTSDPVYLSGEEQRTEDLNRLYLDMLTGVLRWDTQQERIVINGSH